MTRYARLRFACIVAMAALVACPAFAQPSSPDAAALRRAEDLFQEGLRFVREKKWPEAEEKFLAAWAINPTYDVASNLGQTQIRLGKFREAASRLAFALKHWPLVGKKQPREWTAKRLGEARAEVGALTLRVSPGGATVLVDGAAVGKAPLEDEVFVDPGEHTVEARLAGHVDGRQVVKVGKGEKLTVGLVLAAAAPPPPPVASAMASGTAAPPPPSATASAQPPAGPSVAVLVTGGVLAAGGLAAGIGLTVASNGKGNEAEAKRASLVKTKGAAACAQASSDCQSLHDLIGARSTLGSAAGWAFVGAGALGVGTLIYGLVARKAASAVQVTPVVGAREGGVLVQAAW